MYFNTATALSNSTSQPPHLTHVLFRIYHFSAFYFLAPFIPLGIVCNLLIFLIFLKTPLCTTPSTRVYYMAMAFWELGTVLIKDLWFFWFGVGWPTVVWDTLGPLNPHSENSAAFLCPVVVFIWFAHEMPANLTFVVFAIERVVALYFPLRAHYIFNQKRAIYTVASVFIFSISISAISLKITKLIPLMHLMPFDQVCSFDTTEVHEILLGAVVFFCLFIAPAILSAICSVLISIKIISR